MYPAVLLMYFISAAVILLASLALIVQVSLPYNKTGRASVLHNHNIKIGNKSFERLEEPTYLQTTAKHQNSIHEAMKNRLNSGKAYPHSVHNFLSS